MPSKEMKTVSLFERASMRGNDTHLSTAVPGQELTIFLATQILARSMNSSTRLFVSRCSFTSTSTFPSYAPFPFRLPFVPSDSPCSTSSRAALSKGNGSLDSGEERWIFTSGEARLRAPAAMRCALRFWARELRRRIEVVMGSLRLLLCRRQRPV
jgi:hypothetical protein